MTSPWYVQAADASLAWVCSQCVVDGLQVAPAGPRTDGLCGIHMDAMRVELWKRQAQRVTK